MMTLMTTSKSPHQKANRRSKQRKGTEKIRRMTERESGAGISIKNTRNTKTKTGKDTKRIKTDIEKDTRGKMVRRRTTTDPGTRGRGKSTTRRGDTDQRGEMMSL